MQQTRNDKTHTHTINNINQQLDENQTYAITHDYTTMKLNKDLANSLQEESSILYNNQELFNHQKAILTLHGLFPLNLKKPILKHMENRNKEKQISHGTTHIQTKHSKNYNREQ